MVNSIHLLLEADVFEMIGTKRHHEIQALVMSWAYDYSGECIQIQCLFLWKRIVGLPGNKQPISVVRAMADNNYPRKAKTKHGTTEPLTEISASWQDR